MNKLKHFPSWDLRGTNHTIQNLGRLLHDSEIGNGETNQQASDLDAASSAVLVGARELGLALHRRAQEGLPQQAQVRRWARFCLYWYLQSRIFVSFLTIPLFPILNLVSFVLRFTDPAKRWIFAMVSIRSIRPFACMRFSILICNSALVCWPLNCNGLWMSFSIIGFNCKLFMVYRICFCSILAPVKVRAIDEYDFNQNFHCFHFWKMKNKIVPTSDPLMRCLSQ